MDTILAMSRRLIKGKNIGSADKEHLHHQLLKATKSTSKTVLLMYAINLLFSCVSIFYTLGDKKGKYGTVCITINACRNTSFKNRHSI